MSINMIRTFCLIIFLGFSLLSYAQKDLRKGYIITNSGDTLSGMINFQGDIKNSKECVFYPEKDKKEEFHPFDIYGYRFEGGKYYVSKFTEEDEKQIFAEYLVRGQKDLFYYRDNIGNHYLLSKNDSVLIEIPYEEKVVTIDGKTYLQESKEHIGFLKSYFSDCPSVYREIEIMKKPDKNNMISITKKYHDEICGENSCIVYKKNKIPVKFAVEPRLEMTHFKGETGFFNQYGGLIYLWLPESNENLYFKTGFLYSKYENDISLYKVPLRFEYVFPYKVFRPKFDLGLNTYFSQNQAYSEGLALTLAASGGFLVRITKFMYADIDIETDIIQFTFDTGFLISHSFGFGIFVMF